MTTAAETLQRTPFYDFHVEHGAKMVEFAGWEMPILYRSIIEEHHQVRNSGGLFDVSHMGRLRFIGRDARAFLDRVCSRQISGMADGQCRYTLLCNEQGGCRDDVIVNRLSDDEYLMVCNAANRLKLLDHFAAVKGDSVFKLRDETLTTAMIAIQGPKVLELMGPYSRDLAALKRFRLIQFNVLTLGMIIARTGYTGEDGVEVIFPAKSALARSVIKKLLKDVESQSAVVKPAGLGARDTLRIEAGLPLYGNEIDEGLDPLSAGLNFAVKLDREGGGEFIGQGALRRIAEQGPSRRLVGLVLEGRRSARPHMTVQRGEAKVGVVTSGCLSPTLGQPIAMAYVDAAHAHPDETLQVDLGRSVVDARTVKLPFYKAT